MTQGKYFVTDLKVDADRERLSLLEQTWDPATFRHLETLGVAPGWNCLEVGAGYGSTACWLADRVGPKGKVVATDIKAALVRQTNGIVEIRQHDILKDEIENDYFGRQVRKLLDNLEFLDVAFDGFAPIAHAGDTLARELVITSRAISGLLDGLFRQEEIDLYYQLIQDPAFYFVGNTLFSAWGRKPGQEG